MQMDWDKLRVFHAVAEAGSFTHAGELLNLSQSSVSRQIGALEESLNAPLFHRHARGLKLTEQGQLLFSTAKDIFARVAMAEAQVSESRDRPKGPLRISSTITFGSVWLIDRIGEFIEMYPEIEVSVIVTEDELDLAMGEADVAIRVTPPRQGDLVRRKLISMRHRAFAASSYLKEHGAPRQVSDLRRHRLIGFDETIHPPQAPIHWLMSAGLPPGELHRPVFRVNTVYSMFRAASSGLGIGTLPDYIAKLGTNLVPVLDDLMGPPFELYLIYPEELRSSKRIAVFRDFLLRRIGQDLT